MREPPLSWETSSLADLPGGLCIVLHDRQFANRAFRLRAHFEHSPARKCDLRFDWTPDVDAFGQHKQL